MGNSENFVDGTQNERINKEGDWRTGTDQWIENFKNKRWTEAGLRASSPFGGYRKSTQRASGTREKTREVGEEERKG